MPLLRAKFSLACIPTPSFPADLPHSSPPLAVLKNFVSSFLQIHSSSPSCAGAPQAAAYRPPLAGVREKEGRKLQAQIDEFKKTLGTLAKENEAARKGLAELALKKQELQVSALFLIPGGAAIVRACACVAVMRVRVLAAVLHMGVAAALIAICTPPVLGIACVRGAMNMHQESELRQNNHGNRRICWDFPRAVCLPGDNLVA